MVGHHEHVGLGAAPGELGEDPAELGVSGGQRLDGRRRAHAGRVLRRIGLGEPHQRDVGIHFGDEVAEEDVGRVTNARGLGRALRRPDPEARQHRRVVIRREGELRMEDRAARPRGLGVLDVGVAAGPAHHRSEREAVRVEHLPEGRRQQHPAGRRGHRAELGGERRDRPMRVPLGDHQRVAEQPVPARMSPGHHAGRVHPRHGREDGVMAREGDPVGRQPVNGRRSVGIDLGRLEPVEGSDQDPQPGSTTVHCRVTSGAAWRCAARDTPRPPARSRPARSRPVARATRVGARGSGGPRSASPAGSRPR